MRRNRQVGRSGGWWLRTALMLAAVLVLVAGGFVFTIYRQVAGTVDERIDRKPLLPTQALDCPPVGASGTPARRSATAARLAASEPGNARDFVVVRRESSAPGVGKASEFLWAHVSNDRTRVDVMTFAPALRLSAAGCPEETLGDVFTRAGTPGVVSFLSELVHVPVDQVVEVDRQGFALMKRLLDPKVIANPFGVDDAITDAMSHIVFDESMRGDELRSLAFSLRDLKTTRSHSMTQPISAASKSPAPLTASSPSIVRLRRALETDAMASYS